MANTKPNAAQITYQAAGTGAQVRTVDSKLGDSVSVFDFMTPAQITAVKTNTWTADVPDVTSAIQAAINSLEIGSVLYFPQGSYKVINYLLFTAMSGFKVVMEGVIIPTGTLNNLSSGLFHLSGCSDFSIIPNIVNQSYTSTLNCFKLDACTDWSFPSGKIDIKYNAIDGSAVFQLGNATKRGYIGVEYIRGGYGILQNNTSGVEDITIDVGDFVGQVAYGNTGAGDAIEFNGPSNPARNIKVLGGRFSGFYPTTSRHIVCGFANTQGLYVGPGCVFTDIPGMIAVHLEDGASYAKVSPTIRSGHIGVNVACNTTKHLQSISVVDSSIMLSEVVPEATYATGAGIKYATNQLSGGGYTYNLNISNNTVSSITSNSLGISVADHDGGQCVNNVINGFVTGLSFNPSNINSSGIVNSSCSDNIVLDCTTAYNIERISPVISATYYTTFNNVLLKNNRSDLASAAPNVYAATDTVCSSYTTSGIASAVSDGTLTKMFTVNLPNAAYGGQLSVNYTCYNDATGNRIQESGTYIFNIARQTNSIARIASSSKFGNSQLARIGSGTITVALTASAVSGASTANNTIDISYTLTLGTASSSVCYFVASYIGNSSLVTLS